MARHKKTGLDYFPHDVDLSSDEKIEALEALYKNDGYAVYNKLLERIYRQAGELDISDAETRQILAIKFHVDIELFDKIIATCLKQKLFDRKIFESKKILTSAGIKKRVKPVLKKRQTERDKYKNKSAAEKKQKPKVSAVETDIEEKSRVEKSKEENIIKKLDDLPNIPDWVPEVQFKNYVQMRIDTKKNLTVHGIELSVEKLKKLREQGQNLAEVLNRAIEGGWTTLHGLGPMSKNQQSEGGLDNSELRKN